MCSKLDPHWWDICVCFGDTPPPSGEIILFLNDSKNEDSEPTSDSDVALDKFDPSFDLYSSSNSALDANLGGCEPPDFDFSLYTFSFSQKASIEKKLVDIDLWLSYVPAFQYILRRDLKEEKKKLLSLCERTSKGKGKIDSPSDVPVLYNPTDIYKN